MLGFSAGGHLAGHSALLPAVSADSRPDFAVHCYPVVSLRANSHADSGTNLLGPNVPHELAEQNSLHNLVTQNQTADLLDAA